MFLVPDPKDLRQQRLSLNLRGRSQPRVLLNLNQPHKAQSIESNEENAKAENDLKVDNDEFNNVKLHYHTPYKADDQAPSPTNAAGAHSQSMLTDPLIQTSKRTAMVLSTASGTKSCPGRGKAIIEGANLPISSDEKAAANEKKTTPSGTLTAYVTKGKFDINTMNKILLFWIIRQSLPWSRFGDYLLGVAFDYANANAKVFSRTWAAFNARKLYLSLQFKVISDIKLPKNVPDYFPTLELIAEADEDKVGPHIDVDILQLDDVDEVEEINPDDAENAEEDADNYFGDPSNIPTGGIGYTLLKVDYICQRVSSSSARRANFKLVAADKKHTGSLIPGYGICWNVAYDCWQRAYAARRVIDQLLKDESDKFTGKSAAGHYYKGYKISKKEWENVNLLTIVLEEFLALTLSMEDNGPTASMVLYKYRQLIDSLEKKKIAPEFAALQMMFEPMIKVAKKYLDIALGCTPILLATIVHPAWRLSLIKDKFPKFADIALSLVQDAFKAKQEAHNRMLPEPAAPDSNGDDSDEEEFNYYPVKNVSSQDNNKLKKYLDGAYPLSKKGDPLNWWMIHQSEFPRLASVARDALACSATSATVERTFSAAANVCAPGRHSLAAPTIERCVSSHIWLQKGIRADGEFSDCQSVIDTASVNPKFATQVANEHKKIKANKIKHVANANPKSK
ncbi:hypothetical protein H4Q26_001188 [Puccinia striiformis f. sp. tritici PST-130]|nr:hypothetical protein H4Q26_001188 [Puccinia striiformis f. sp. tritici PST-130]